MIRYGTTEGSRWSETLATAHGAPFTGRTFSRCHLPGDMPGVPTVHEIWATSEHAVDGHAHGGAELLYVLRGVIEVSGQALGANEVVFIPGGASYTARVLSSDGCHVLRVAFPSTSGSACEPEYAARAWSGPVTTNGFPDLWAGASAV